MYRNCFGHSERFLYTTCSPHVLKKGEFLTKIYLQLFLVAASGKHEKKARLGFLLVSPEILLVFLDGIGNQIPFDMMSIFQSFIFVSYLDVRMICQQKFGIFAKGFVFYGVTFDLCRFCTFLSSAQLAGWAKFKDVQNLHKSNVTP